MADSFAIELPQGFASVADFESFAGRASQAVVQIQRLHAAGSCLALAAAIQARPLIARARLIETAGRAGARIRFQMRLADGRFADPVDAVMALTHPSEDDAWMAKQLPGVDGDKLFALAKEASQALAQALAPLLLHAQEPLARALAKINARDGGQDGSWLPAEASGADIARILGLPDIAADMDAFELRSKTACQPTSSSAGRPSL